MTDETTNTTVETKDTSYEDQFGGEASKEFEYDPDKIKPEFEELDLDKEETHEIPEGEELEKVEEEKTTEEPVKKEEVAVDYKTELEKARAEFEQYRQTEQERFNAFYQQEQQKKAQEGKLLEEIDKTLDAEEMAAEFEKIETPKDLSKFVLKQSVKMAEKLISEKIAPLFEYAKHLRTQEINTNVNRSLTEFKDKYKEEAEVALKPGTPINTALLKELKWLSDQNPNIQNPYELLEKAFLLVRPSSIEKKVEEGVKKVIDSKKSMALPPSSGRSTVSAPAKIDSVSDAFRQSLNELKKRN